MAFWPLSVLGSKYYVPDDADIILIVLLLKKTNFENYFLDTMIIIK